MKRKIQLDFMVSGVLFLLFAVLTVMVRTIDVKPIGPESSFVGLASVNGFISGFLGVNLFWYQITEWLGAAAVMTAFGFAVLGLYQWIKRKSIRKIDDDIIILGVFYLIVIGFYILFEVFIVNYRPVIGPEGLEASYPSSHTMTVLFIMATAMLQFHDRFENNLVRNGAETAAAAVLCIVVIGRFLSGVHWFTDILGGIFLGAALVMLYYSVTEYRKTKQGLSGRR